MLGILFGDAVEGANDNVGANDLRGGGVVGSFGG